MTALTITRLNDVVGAEITGLDPERLGPDDTLAAALLDALEQHGVLVFRGLHLDPGMQVSFCSRLGEVEMVTGTHPVPGIYRVTLDQSKNANADYLKGTFIWHIDGCTPVDDEAPQKATCLSAVAVAEAGGETELASTYAAYDRLSADEKVRYERLPVVHTFEASQRQAWPEAPPEHVARWKVRPPHEHPLVWTHRDGRKSLVIGASTSHVVGMDPGESRALLDDLLARATQPRFVYRHEWSVGDTVIWDNRGLVHRASPYPADSPREMLRTTILGDEHIG
ncbi:MAG TPA: TauD/TfdA family dioxygenase [Acidimicrobiales bacterium]|nr:TauD/TfdA family dioxygenase [Acidimicrobiales bacterium]